MLRDTGARTAVRRKDYTPPPYLIDTTELKFELGDAGTMVTATLALRRNPAAVGPADPLVLDGAGLELLAIQIDGRPLAPDSYRAGPDELVIHAPPDRFTLQTCVRIHPESNTALVGLYKSSGNFCTQCEAEGFRRITYYLDRPDVLARFTTRIEADRDTCPVLLSNGNLGSQGNLERNRHYAEWEDPFPKPSYLFALVAGRLACLDGEHRTCSGRTVPLKVYVEPHNVERAAHALASLKRAMEWDERRYGREYDLDTFMIVAVDDFNMGAMENKGLNLFNSKYVLADPDTATDEDYAGIEAVIGHEYFHNWTGNRVTLRDWFQLSLKEGLTVFREQCFSAEMTSPAVKRIKDVRFLRQHQFPEDAGPMAHPVRPDHYLEINNFYTATIYEKGAEIVRMYHTLLGADGFRRGMDLYFKRHDGQAVTTDEFRAAMADANDVDLSQFARWYEVAGTPRLEAHGRYNREAGAYTLELRQRHDASPGQHASGKPPLLMPVAVALFAPDGSAVPARMNGENGTSTEHVLWLRDAEQTFVFEGVAAPPVPSLLRGFSAPVKLTFDYSDEDLAFLVQHDDDAFNRWDAAQTLISRLVAARTRTRKPAADASVLIKAFGALLRREGTDPALVAEALTFPTESTLAQQFDQVDVEALSGAWHGLQQEIAAALESELVTLWQRTQSDETYRYRQQDVWRRRLRGTVLELLGALATQEHLQRAEETFASADNMTERLAALRVLAAQETTGATNALAQFRSRYGAEPLVLDKWFSVQAVAPLADPLARVRRLADDPAFTLRNPNRVRALLGTFTHRNHAGFHSADGAAYRFIADHVLALDRINPQVAARLVTGFVHWRRYDPMRQEKMRSELQRIAAAPTLSRDVFEIVDRALVG